MARKRKARGGFKKGTKSWIKGLWSRHHFGKSKVFSW